MSSYLHKHFSKDWPQYTSQGEITVITIWGNVINTSVPSIPHNVTDYSLHLLKIQKFECGIRTNKETIEGEVKSNPCY